MRVRGPHQAVRLFAHLTWHTWRRLHVVTAADVPVITTAIRNAAARTGCDIVAQAVLSEHVHVVLRFHQTVHISSFVREAKSESARRVNEKHGNTILRWSRGYYADSISPRHMHAVRIYIANQHRRHPDKIPKA